MVPGRPGIAFVEYQTEMHAATAMMGLQNFKVRYFVLVLVPLVFIWGCTFVSIFAEPLLFADHVGPHDEDYFREEVNRLVK